VLQTDYGITVASAALAMPALRHAVKTGSGIKILYLLIGSIGSSETCLQSLYKDELMNYWYIWQTCGRTHCAVC